MIGLLFYDNFLFNSQKSVFNYVKSLFFEFVKMSKMCFFTTFLLII